MYEDEKMKEWKECKNAGQTLFCPENCDDNFVYEAVQGKLCSQLVCIVPIDFPRH